MDSKIEYAMTIEGKIVNTQSDLYEAITIFEMMSQQYPANKIELTKTSTALTTFTETLLESGPKPIPVDEKQ